MLNMWSIFVWLVMNALVGGDRDEFVGFYFKTKIASLLHQKDIHAKRPESWFAD